VRIATFAAVLILPIVLASACGGKDSPDEAGMSATVQAFTAALNAGNYEEAYGMFSNQCRQHPPSDQEQFAKQWKDILSPETGDKAELAFINLKVVSHENDMYNVKTTFELTRGGTTYSFGSESDPFIEWMVKEEGEWRIHDKVCEIVPLPSSGSPTPSAEGTSAP
jgi:hypothetical protein